MTHSLHLLRHLQGSALARREFEGVGQTTAVLVRAANEGEIIIGCRHSEEQRGQFWLHGSELRLTGQAQGLTFLAWADTQQWTEGRLQVVLGYCTRSDGRALTYKQQKALRLTFEDAFLAVQSDLPTLIAADEWFRAEARRKVVGEEIDSLTSEYHALLEKLGGPRPW